jgi:outer membrane protein OmpA-like peptidoglycan-associated protein
MLLRTPLIIASVSILALSACDPNTQTALGGPNATAGAVTGALVGAAAAASAPGNSRLAQGVAGGILGAAVGGVIGQTLDRQAADLQGSVSGNTKIVNTGNSLVVTMPQDILFATNSATLRPDLKRDLDAVAANLIRYPNSNIEIVGHTDNTGTAALNQDLSLRRANAVASALMQAGVPNSRIATIGRGEDAPIASNLTPEGRALNRRVDIIIWPRN